MLSPISPDLPPDPGEGGGEHHQLQEDVVDFSKAMLDDPIVGVEQVISDQHGPGARQPRALPVPKPTTPAENEIHDLSHLPYDLRCEICRATRGLNAPHRTISEQLRVIPLMVADYCFLSFAGCHNLLVGC